MHVEVLSPRRVQWRCQCFTDRQKYQKVFRTILHVFLTLPSHSARRILNPSKSSWNVQVSLIGQNQCILDVSKFTDKIMRQYFRDCKISESYRKSKAQIPCLTEMKNNRGNMTQWFQNIQNMAIPSLSDLRFSSVSQG